MTSTVDFRPLANNRFEVTLPAGVTPSVAARAIFAARSGMAFDAAMESGGRLDHAKVALEQILQGRLSSHEAETAKRLLATIVAEAEKKDMAEKRAGQREAEMAEQAQDDDDEEADRDDDESVEIEVEEDEAEMTGEERARLWRALVKELRPKFEEKYGRLPRTALEGGMGGRVEEDRELARDARRRAAFDARWPTAPRADTFDMRGATRPETMSAATLARWGEAAARIKHT
jgi:hypothetical protein